MRGGLCGGARFSKVASNIRIALREKGELMKDPVVARSGALGVTAMGAKAVKGFAAVATVSSLLALSGCKMFVKEEPPPCPRVSILADAAKLTRFRPGPGRDVTDMVVQAEVSSYHGSCFYNSEAKTMSIDIQVGINAQKGAALVDNKVEVAYFVAIPAFFPEPQAKAVLPVTLEFPKNSHAVRLTDEQLAITIPVKDVKELGGYEVFLGFQLEPAELEYNRQHAAKQ